MIAKASNTGIFNVTPFGGGTLEYITGFYAGSSDQWLQVWDCPGPSSGPSSTYDTLLFSQRLFANAPFHWNVRLGFSTGLVVCISQQPSDFQAAPDPFQIVEVSGRLEPRPPDIVVARSILNNTNRQIYLSESPVRLYVANFRTVVPADQDELWFQVWDAGRLAPLLSMNGSAAGATFNGAFGAGGIELPGSSSVAVSGSPVQVTGLTGSAVATAVYRVLT